MPDYEEADDLYIWCFKFKGTAQDENETTIWAMNHELSREAHRLAWEMDWLIKNADSPKEVHDCADKMRDVEIRQFDAARKWIHSRTIPDAI